MDTVSTDFSFGPRNILLDWKKLSSVNIDQLIKRPDFSVLQENLLNVAFCNIHNEFDLSQTDQTFIKMFLLSQLVIEYLLFSQDIFVKKLQENIEIMENLEKKQQQSDAEINEAKAKWDKTKLLSQKWKKVLLTQHKLIKHGADYYRHECGYCKKTFANESYLKNHQLRRHNHELFDTNINNSVLHKDLESENNSLKKEIEDLKENFEREMKNIISREEEFNKLTKEMRNEFESNIEKLKRDNEEKFAEIRKMTTKQINESNAKQKEAERALAVLQNRIHCGKGHKDPDDSIKGVLQCEIDSLKEFNAKLKKELETKEAKWKEEEAEIKRKHEKKSKTAHVGQFTNQPSFNDEKQSINSKDPNPYYSHYSDEDLDKIFEANLKHVENFAKKSDAGSDKKKISSQTSLTMENKIHSDNAVKEPQSVPDPVIQIKEDILLQTDKCMTKPGKRPNKVLNLESQFVVDEKRLKTIRDEVENEIVLELESKGIRNMFGVTEASYETVSKLLAIERSKLAKNLHGFLEFRENMEDTLKHLIEERPPQHPSLSEIISHSLESEDQQLVKPSTAQKSSSCKIEKRLDFKNSSNSGNQKILKNSFNTDSDISEWDELSSLTEKNGDGPGMLNISQVLGQMPSLGSVAGSDVSSILSTEGSGGDLGLQKVLKETKLRSSVTFSDEIDRISESPSF